MGFEIRQRGRSADYKQRILVDQIRTFLLLSRRTTKTTPSELHQGAQMATLLVKKVAGEREA
jgi:hypothetical protein